MLLCRVSSGFEPFGVAVGEFIVAAFVSFEGVDVVEPEAEVVDTIQQTHAGVPCLSV